MADTIKISLELGDQAAQNALSNFIKNGTKADQAVSKLKENSKSTFQEIALSIGKTSGVYDIFAGNLAANLVTKAFESIRGVLSHVIDEAAGSEQAIKNLNVALQQAGQYTPKASQDLQDFAGKLQATTIYSDEMVLSTESLLLNLTSLSKDGVLKATQAAADLATTLNVPLSDATDKIIKSVNGNNIAFKKMGIEIESADTDSDRLTNTLKALSSQQNASTKVTDTYAGAVAKAKNQQSELFEALGKIITQSPAYVGEIRAQSDAYKGLADFVTSNTQVIRDLGTAVAITTGIFAAGAALYPVVTYGLGLMYLAAGTGTTVFGALGIAASSAWAAITAPVSLVVIGVASVVAIVYQLVKNWEAVKASTYDALAATIEFSAKSASLISDKVANRLFEQAKGYREQAKAIRETALASEAKAKSDTVSDERSKQQIDVDRKRRADAESEAVRHADYLKNVKIINQQEIALIEAQSAQASADLLILHNQEMEAKESEFDTLRLESINRQSLLRLESKQALDRQELEVTIAKQVALANAETDGRKRREELEKISDKSKISRLALQSKQELDQEKITYEGQKKLDELRIANRRDTFATIATLSTSNNQTLATIGKAAGITQIAIETPVAIAKALSAFPPPFNLVAAGVVGAAMAAQAAQIAGIQFADGGIVPGSSFSGDKVAARVNSGEMVLNRTQQAELFKMANGAGNGQNGITREDLVNFANTLASKPVIVQVDGRELFNITRDQLNSGRKY